MNAVCRTILPLEQFVTSDNFVNHIFLITFWWLPFKQTKQNVRTAGGGDACTMLAF